MTGAPTAVETGGFRLSPQQRRVWRLTAAHGGAPWRVVGAWRVTGELEPERLTAALRAAVRRTEILRTRFRRPAGMSKPLQVIEPELPARVETRDLSSLPEPEQAAAVENLLDAAWREPFDLAEGPLLRAMLACLAPGRSLLILSAPALCLDRPALAALAAELAAGDTAEADGEEPLQYADLAEWQTGLLASEDGAESREAWRRLDLPQAARRWAPFETAPGAGTPYDPRTVDAEIPAPLGAACAALAERSGASLGEVVLAAWTVALGRLLGADGATLGVVVDGRQHEELRRALGALAKVVPLRLAGDSAWPPEHLVEEAREALAEARASQEYWAWEAVTAEGDDDALPVLPFGFEARREPPALTWGEARLEPVFERSSLEPFSLHMVCRQPAAAGRGPSSRAPRLELHYDAGRIGEEDARRTLDQVLALLVSLTAAGCRAVREADGLGAAERRWLDGDASAAAPAGPTVVRRFEEHASSDPERRALVCGDRSLTYGELEALTRRRAERLRALGVGPERLVAVCCDRSLDLVPAILAVLRAGGAYLALDPALPRRRVAALIEASGVGLVLAEEPFRELFAGSPAEVLTCDALDRQPAAPEAGPLPAPRPEDLAYVLYTSGSTGSPKGVAVEHRQLAAYVAGALDRLDLPSGGSFATVSSFAADLGHTMVFPALATGGCLHVIASDQVSDPEAFAAYAARHAIDCLKIVPSHLEALLTAADPGRVLPRQRLVLGGETLRWELAERVRELAPGCRVFNHYGPTETTVGVVAGAVPDARGRTLTVPLGRPLGGSWLHLLDPASPRPRPVPTWAGGEVYIGGAGLARGYLGRPAATAERFVPDPFAPTGRPGARLYRSGDLARRLPDGACEFLGRADGQVKVRGFRVESGEIEAVLREHPSVRQAVVVARGDGDGTPRLVAYAVPHPGQELAPPALRTFLAERLPDAMVPSALVALKALPLTANGKLDRDALPAPEAVRPELAAAFVAPASELEHAVAAIWRDVLDLDRVGLHDNFFDLGGHSLLLVQVAARLRRELGREISMVELFRRTTVAQLVALLSGDGPEPAVDAAAGEERATARRGALRRQREQRRRREATR